MTAREPSLVGTVLSGKWQLERLIGKGGMATVYGGQHVRNGLPVAVKVLHPHLAAHASVRLRFQREGYLANRVDHPGVVRVIDDGFEAGRAYLVMDLLAGESLGDAWTREGPRLTVNRIWPILDEVLQILAAAHSIGIVHRDVKPDNVFLSSTGGVRLLDFGIARLHESPDAPRTMTGELMGTPAFMPPEQAAGRWSEVDARSDVFAVGATAFSLLAGRLLHDAQTVSALVVTAASTPAPSIRSVLPELASPCAKVIDRALAFCAADRWASAQDMLAAWRDAAERVEDGTTDRIPARDQSAGGVTERMTHPQALLGESASWPSTIVIPPTQRDPTSGGRASLARLALLIFALATLGVVAAYALFRIVL